MYIIIGEQKVNNMLTKKQNIFFKRLKSLIKNEGYFPSMRELKKYFGFSSTNTIWKYLKILESKGYLKKNNGTYELTDIGYFISVPLVGIVPAGEPLEIFSELGESIELPPWFVPENYQDIIALKVKGQSMKDAYIDEGDIVVVKRGDDVNSGDMVIAILPDNSITLKRLKIDDDCYILVPENPEYSPIITKEIKIIGKLIGVLRKYE